MSSQIVPVTSPESQVVNLAKISWYAVRTRSNHERTTSVVLAGKGYEQYLPPYRVKRRWSDRVVNTQLPLFPGYVFCRFDPKRRLPILSTPGVVTIVGFGDQPAPIRDEEIEAVQTMLRSEVAAEPCPFLRVGQRIRVTQSSLRDLEGILVKKKSGWRLVVSVTMLQRSVSVDRSGLDHHNLIRPQGRPRIVTRVTHATRIQKQNDQLPYNRGRVRQISQALLNLLDS